MELKNEDDVCPILPLKQQYYTIKTVDKICNTVQEMFKDRGYMIIPKSKWPERINQLEDLKIVAQVGSVQHTTSGSKLDHTPIEKEKNLPQFPEIDDKRAETEIGSLNQPPQKTGILFSSLVHVYFAIDPKVPVKKMRDYIQHMTDSKVNHAIIVYAHQITPSAKSEIPPNLVIETFKANELFENITKHKLVPPHYKLDDFEVLELLKLKKTEKHKLPRYDPEDPIVKYYHWPIGSVIKIIRKFGNHQDPQIYWRHVRVCP